MWHVITIETKLLKTRIGISTDHLHNKMYQVLWADLHNDSFSLMSLISHNNPYKERKMTTNLCVFTRYFIIKISYDSLYGSNMCFCENMLRCNINIAFDF